MDQESAATIISALKDEGIDLVVTLPEEPTFSLTEAIRADPYFTALTAASEGGGITACASSWLCGRKAVFVTGVAGLMVGTWALSQVGLDYGLPVLIIASYRGDIGDRSGISGPQLFVFNQVAEPLMDALRVPYRVVSEKKLLGRTLRDAAFACEQYRTPLVVFLTGEVLW